MKADELQKVSIYGIISFFDVISHVTTNKKILYESFVSVYVRNYCKGSQKKTICNFKDFFVASHGKIFTSLSKVSLLPQMNK